MSHKHFTMSHKKIHLDKETVEYKLATIKPEPINKVYVKVGNKKFPVNQVLAEVTGLIKSRVRTQESVRILAGIGFNPKEKKAKKGRRG